jgi:quinol monooxygenase YgiN
MDGGHKGGKAGNGPRASAVLRDASIAIEAFHEQFVFHRIVFGVSHAISRRWGEARRNIMDHYASNERTIHDAISGGGLVVVAQWEAKEGEADKVAGILARFLPEAQREEGAKLFLISRAKENPAQFLFYELFRDEAAFKAHQDSAHFKTYIAGQALPLLAKRERTQYALL